jgi:hypothetical protein
MARIDNSLFFNETFMILIKRWHLFQHVTTFVLYNIVADYRNLRDKNT